MPKADNDFKCLRCGHTYVDLYDSKEPEERTCPECRSNSVRPLPRARPARRGAPAGAKAG